MGSLGEHVEDEWETLQRGCFPTSSKRLLDIGQACSFPVLGAEVLYALGLSTFGGIQRVANVSWAILLRAYLRTNHVSFMLLHDGKHDVPEIVHYSLLGHVRLDEIHEVDTTRSGKAGYSYVDINTAVRHTNERPTKERPADGAKANTRKCQTSDSCQYLLTLEVNLCIPDITIIYNQPAISEQYAQAVANTYQHIFMSLCQRENPRLDELDSISGVDYQTMKSWNHENPFDSEEYQCMHHLVEAKVKEIPRAEAVCAWDGSLTYQELDESAESAAQRLVHAGVGPGVFVPFAYEKSMWAVVAALAILKAGGAFVPINPHDPVSRLAEILNKVSAHVVVTMDKFIPTFRTLVETVIVISNGISDNHEPHHTVKNGAVLQESVKNGFTRHVSPFHQGYASNESYSTKAREIKPTDPIVVLFTSGSTGQPKGIVLEHRAICTHAIAHGSKMGYHNARVLQFAAHTFDVALMDYFTTLSFGGCVCIPSEEERKGDIIGVINRMEVNYALLTPSFAGLIDPSEVPTMRTLAIGGEALPQDRVHRWSDNVRMIQVYGPAEVGICLTMDMKFHTTPETVGFPLSNSSCWLVDPDDHDTLVPIGAVGELMIAGPSLARGYLNNEAKTRTSFIDNPKWAANLGLKCERFYLSGDLLRFNTSSFDGSYDIIGRKDAQIKLRGQRIEPAEIEYHVGRISGVAVSMVTRPSKGYLAEGLVCIVQMHDHDLTSSRVRDEPIRLSRNQGLTVKRLREHLAQLLPIYMIPSACLTIDAMPLVPSLKIDRRRVHTWLNDLETHLALNGNSHMPKIPPNEVTALVLGQQISSIVAAKDDNRRSFLEGKDFGLQSIGINSIQVISLSMYLQREHATKVPIDTLLSPDLTVRKLAQVVERLRPSENSYTNGDHPDGHSLGVMSPPFESAHEVQTFTAELFHSFSTPATKDVEDEEQAHSNYNIFLTGATGYLGSIILQRLLYISRIEVFVLVRCTSPEEGMQRIIASATTYKWWDPSYRKRIHVWPGDLTKPNLDLAPAHLRLLSNSATHPSSPSRIHSIIHNGALVHYSSSYAALSPTNITPTLSLLRLAASSPNISNFVFVSGGLKPNIPLQPPPQSLDSAGGYAQTKYVSSALVSACATHPLFRSKSLYIVKPGYIMGSSTTAGVANTSDFIWRLVAGCCEIGAYNADEADHWLFISDVEEVADVIVSGALSRDQDGVKEDEASKAASKVEPILTGLLFSSLWNLLQSKFGYSLQPLPHDQWLSKLKSKIMDKGDEHLLFPLLHVLERDGEIIGEEISQVGRAGHEGIEQGNGEERRVLRAVEANVRYLIGVGMLPETEAVTLE